MRRADVVNGVDSAVSVLCGSGRLLTVAFASQLCHYHPGQSEARA